MQIEKKYLPAFFLSLKATDGVLSLREARVRDSMLKPLTEATATFEKDRIDIYSKFGTRSEDGQSFTFPPEKYEEVSKEVEMLNSETVDLPEVVGLKEIVEKTEYKPKAGEAEVIDQILTLLK